MKDDEVVTSYKDGQTDGQTDLLKLAWDDTLSEFYKYGVFQSQISIPDDEIRIESWLASVISRALMYAVLGTR